MVVWVLAAFIFWVGPAVRAEAVEDTAITDAVENELLSDEAIPFDLIDVSTSNAIVTLTGRVGNLLSKERAAKIARIVKGVRTVINDLRVYKTTSTYPSDPYVDEWDIRNFDWYQYQPGFPSKRDLEIEAGIRYELVWSPFVDADDISVTVDRGTATLSGTVGSNSERSMAEANAYEGGANRVINNLEVQSNGH